MKLKMVMKRRYDMEQKETFSSISPNPKISKGFVDMKYFFVLLVVGLMVLPAISAVAISQDYHNLNPVRILPGESEDIIFGRFQNNEDADKILEITLVDDAGIGVLTSENLDNFVVSAKDMNVPLNMRISIPEDAVEGTSYNILVNYKDITPSDATGMVVIAYSETVSIPVIAGAQLEVPSDDVENEEAGLLLWIAVIVGIILIGILIFWIIRIRRADSPENADATNAETVIEKK
jgi:hypothetical protein